jgi:hypothetical protein
VANRVGELADLEEGGARVEAEMGHVTQVWGGGEGEEDGWGGSERLCSGPSGSLHLTALCSGVRSGRGWPDGRTRGIIPVE